MRSLATGGLLLALLSLTLGPTKVRAHESLGRRLDRIEAALEDTPADPKLHLERVGLLRRAGRHPEAKLALKQAAGRSLELPELWLEAAMVAVALGLDEEARATFARTEAAKLRTAESEELRSRLLLRQGEPQAGVRALLRSVRLGPTPDRILSLGRLQVAQGDREAARGTFTRGLAKLGPTEVLTGALVKLELSGGQPERALQLIEAELRARPNRAGWERLRAQALASLERPKEARRSLERARRLALEAVRLRPTPAHRQELERIQQLLDE